MSNPMLEVPPEVPPEAPESPETDVEPLDGAGTSTDELEAPEEPQTFDRDYVEKLRKEAAEHRVKSRDESARADSMARHLVTALAEQTGRLHDATDLAYSPDLLDENDLPDSERVATAVQELIASKPHLARIRVVGGDVGQGPQGQQDTMPSLGSMLKQAAG